MKKSLILFGFLFALMSLLIGCNQNTSDGTVETTENTVSTVAAVNPFMVGYARVDITPKESVPMGGYSDGRLSTLLILMAQ